MKKIMVGLFVMLLLVGGAFAYHYNEKPYSTNVILDIQKATVLNNLFSSLGLLSSYTLQSQYSPGDVVKLTGQQSTYKDCPGTLSLCTELYSSACLCSIGGSAINCETRGGHCTGHDNSYSGLHSCILAGSSVPATAWSIDTEVALTSSSKIGKWSASVYLVCDSFSGQLPPSYGEVSTPEFDVVASNPVTTQRCGNSIPEGNEICDGDSARCQTSDGYEGVVQCLSNCLDYDWNNCVSILRCGDGKISGNEQCDGSNLNGYACTTPIIGGFTSGTLKCSSECKFDKSGCVGTPSTPTGTEALTKFANPTGIQINSITTTTAQGVVYGKVALTNNGVAINPLRLGIIEMQVVPAQAPFFSVLSGEYQNMCDGSYPQNVNFNIFLNPGQTKLYQLISPTVGSLTKGTYKVGYFISTQCPTEGVPGVDRTLPGYTTRGPFGVSTITVNPEDNATTPENVGLGGLPGSGVSGPCNTNYDCTLGNYCIAGECQYANLTYDQAERVAADAAANAAACPKPGTVECIPDGCPYIDGTKTVLGSTTATTSYCCEGLYKKEVSASDASWGKAAGAIAGAGIGAATVKTTTGTLIGGSIGGIIGSWAYSEVKQTGFCSETTPGFDFCKFNIPGMISPDIDCTTGWAIQAFILIFLLMMMRK